jgi:cytochrome c-type biogenesis protein CcmH
MRTLPRCRAVAAGLLLAAAALAGVPEDEARYQALIEELRCLVCQNQSIAESNAPLAADLREQVRRQIEAGRSDAEIIAFLTDRYGDFVRYRPPFRARTWLLWLGPFVALLAGAALVALFIRRSQRAPAPAVDPAAVQRVLDEDAGRDRRP